ncbi:16S rRNA methyltransferase RsmH [Sphingomonas changbaiensis NBRC 104936]|uniref:Ribosomal RNA small subunit methyltransferase H n=1 Tax=Sphingomonas changbaiensis NBRC 104936 TaxID=1219043 RepID=A0A0E9MNZ3_9SPHN|nr:16S rRNA (cytosine(1402)-N(4))-methyltransferase RsmH [Sphingomonas changbaiensis]GAO39472.1 16S rRNA methyltransferase RsmH [Sphingomonas changbaiensis NBRC 104936]
MSGHVPVLLDEVIDALAIRPGERHVDGTFGAGGYTRAMLAKGARVYAFDRDPGAIAAGRAIHDAELTLIERRFSEMEDALADVDALPVDGVTLDIGVSSMQFDQADRGFSVQADGPLDMRMEQAGMTAAEWLNSADEAEIADVIYRYGEERRSRRIARAIVAARPLERTLQLAAVVRKSVGFIAGKDKDPAVQVFQAIRIYLNRELDELTGGLEAAERVLAPGGRLAVVTFHSLEDRIVKQFLRDRSGQAPAGSRHLPAAKARRPSFEAVGKAVRPGARETAANPRARSATLRVARRTSAEAWSNKGEAA